MARTSRCLPFVFLVPLLLAPAIAQQPGHKQLLADRPVTMQTLLDRVNIEDFLTRYYYDLTVGKAHALSEYFTEDAVLDVDNIVARGHAEIEKLYARPANADAPATKTYRRMNMLLTNPIINIDGDRATAHVIWTGVMNEGAGKAPTLHEQGREYTELRKVKGRWLITRRFISSDSGLPDKYDATWAPREHR
ncbi:MAG: hypothetical protein RLZZ393_2114 [Pseudomonadota bacterium]|jgi:ketosteroid isomerase-like protein